VVGWLLRREPAGPPVGLPHCDLLVVDAAKRAGGAPHRSQGPGLIGCHRDHYISGEPFGCGHHQLRSKAPRSASGGRPICPARPPATAKTSGSARWRSRERTATYDARKSGIVISHRAQREARVVGSPPGVPIWIPEAVRHPTAVDLLAPALSRPRGCRLGQHPGNSARPTLCASAGPPKPSALPSSIPTSARPGGPEGQRHASGLNTVSSTSGPASWPLVKRPGRLRSATPHDQADSLLHPAA
jgi:hypothetical protein